MHYSTRITVCLALAGALNATIPVTARAADNATSKGFFSFGPDQTIVDIGKVEWQPLKLEGLPPGIEIATLRGDLDKGGGEILLRVPANYTVPNHSHTSDELYVWLRGAFTYIAADGQQAEIDGPAYISLPGNTPHALKCHSEPCVFYVRYSRPLISTFTRCRSDRASITASNFRQENAPVDGFQVKHWGSGRNDGYPFGAVLEDRCGATPAERRSWRYRQQGADSGPSPRCAAAQNRREYCLL